MVSFWDTYDNTILQMGQFLHKKSELTRNEKSPPSICDLTKGTDPSQVSDSAPSMVVAILPRGCLVFCPLQNMTWN